MIHCLYKTTNLLNSKFYIGVHSTNDINFGTPDYQDDYIGSGKLIKRALNKYGRQAFKVEIIAYFDTEDFAYQAEKDLVTEDWLNQYQNKTYNMNLGGNKPPKSTSESQRKGYQTRVKLGVQAKGTGLMTKEEGQRRHRISVERGTYRPPPRHGIPPPNHSNTIWVNNGSINKRTNIQNIPEGFVLGRLPVNWSEEGRRKIREGTILSNKLRAKVK